VEVEVVFFRKTRGISFPFFISLFTSFIKACDFRRVNIKFTSVDSWPALSSVLLFLYKRFCKNNEISLLSSAVDDHGGGIMGRDMCCAVEYDG
jgi:hypothetical protein